MQYHCNVCLPLLAFCQHEMSYHLPLLALRPHVMSSQCSPLSALHPRATSSQHLPLSALPPQVMSLQHLPLLALRQHATSHQRFVPTWHRRNVCRCVMSFRGLTKMNESNHNQTHGNQQKKSKIKQRKVELSYWLTLFSTRLSFLFWLLHCLPLPWIKGHSAQKGVSWASWGSSLLRQQLTCKEKSSLFSIVLLLVPPWPSLFFSALVFRVSCCCRRFTQDPEGRQTWQIATNNTRKLVKQENIQQLTKLQHSGSHGLPDTVQWFVVVKSTQQVDAQDSNQSKLTQQDSRCRIGEGGRGRSDVHACPTFRKGLTTRDWGEVLGLGWRGMWVFLIENVTVIFTCSSMFLFIPKELFIWLDESRPIIQVLFFYLLRRRFANVRLCLKK